MLCIALCHALLLLLLLAVAAGSRRYSNRLSPLHL